MMNFQNIIFACNQCILESRKCIDFCQKCSDICKIDNPSCKQAEDCAVSCQKVIDACFAVIHECNVIIDNKAYKNEKQEYAILKCKKVCQNCLNRCKETIDSILTSKIEKACLLPLEILDYCIISCDELIEAFGA